MQQLQIDSFDFIRIRNLSSKFQGFAPLYGPLEQADQGTENRCIFLLIVLYIL